MRCRKSHLLIKLEYGEMLMFAILKPLKKANKFIPYLLFLLLMIGTISMKTNYHVDEIYSYGLANNAGEIIIEFEDGVKYEPSEIPFVNYLTVDSENRFDYKMVWANQAKDVHPPLYYAVLHTICSFFPGRFSKWFAGIINIIFGLATLFVFRKLLSYYCSNPALREVISIGFVFSAGILSNVSFFRMYVMAMFWVISLCYVYISHIGKNFDWEFCLQSFLIITLGALTHYYCIVFAVLISAVFGVYQLICRQWKNVLLLCVSTMLAGRVAYRIFPAMTFHVFSGQRGTEALENLSNTSDYWNRLKCFYGFINKDLFGGYLAVVIIVLLPLLLVRILRDESEELPEKQSSADNKQWLRNMILLIPIGIYFLLVSKMAAYVAFRYLLPVYAVTFLVLMTLLTSTLRKWVSKRNCVLVTCALVGIISVGTWQHASWEYLYLGTSDFLQTASQYSEVDCICIYDIPWKVHPMFLEAKQYKSINFVNKDNTEVLDRLIEENDNPVVLTVIGVDDKMQYVNLYLEKSENLSTSTEIGSYAYGTSYYLNDNQ